MFIESHEPTTFTLYFKPDLSNVALFYFFVEQVLIVSASLDCLLVWNWNMRDSIRDRKEKGLFYKGIV